MLLCNQLLVWSFPHSVSRIPTSLWLCQSWATCWWMARRHRSTRHCLMLTLGQTSLPWQGSYV